MAKFGVQELATILVNKGGLSNDEAVSFVNAFFDLIQEGMNIDEIVKVKGLGTFKLVNVEARESVNVNTGERVLIDSHAKISFTPDTTMKDIVNKPFSSFETVILNEGVTFDDMNPVVATESDIESEDAAEYETEVYTEPEAPEAPVEEVETSTEEIVTSDTVDETAIEEPQQVEQQEETTTTADDNSEMIEIAEEEVPASDDTEVVTDSDDNIDNTDNTDNTDISNDNKSWVIYGAVVAALLVGFIAGVFLSDNVKNLINSQKEDVVEQELVPSDEKQHKDSMIIAATNDSAAAKKDSVFKDSVQAVKAEPQTTEAAKTNVVESEPEYKKYEQMDSRVRYGAYYIMGTASVVKTKKDDTSDRLSRRYLGEGMACYIEVYNGITASSVLPEGQDIKIPKLEWKKNVNKKNKQ
ncbi:HU family DNA-binding protein [Prevotella sp. E13-27]|uniref:HU family DNA-binding protein n=1 Tax=Prevotella sp. E13-27 TaxID=2938122 RepID=UPI00200A8AC4|nr:HU family DNA-binding protein [Prevotella sp. E13-27]MCK8623474.1 HU family DNA-binding protein [Prevotella sp. E13-27]